ncbi:uncharacterized protein M421DRAFT_425307 [Didymella exigua CBS 183.55]|uniref:Uncharacterized protein n=1 Tax=Didymella exigua CBS 183.55 TaxID=1150837 RepID=A0A6A5R734_9PLEO|nr:uncharacterized protein M421DRAFT_425307 [Didymella exigua CBS 183.55]KAF1923965.1 hypothetical protein M421DRAFT_425307 [Didymella exigua CBS 183.55]
MACISPEYNAHTMHTRTATAPASVNSRFESLPRELRDIVYHELWRFTPKVSAKYKGIDMQLLLRSNATDQASSRPASQALPLPVWLRTRKSILHEGLAELQHSSSWTVGP